MLSRPLTPDTAYFAKLWIKNGDSVLRVARLLCRPTADIEQILSSKNITASTNGRKGRRIFDVNVFKKMVAKNMKNPEIARQLGISYDTAYRYSRMLREGKSIV